MPKKQVNVEQLRKAMNYTYSKAFDKKDIEGINKALENGIVRQLIETEGFVIITYQKKSKLV